MIRKGLLTTAASGISAAVQMLNGILVARGLGVNGLGHFRTASDFTILAGTVAGLGVGTASIFLINNRRMPARQVTGALLWLGLTWCPVYCWLLAQIFYMRQDYFGVLEPFVVWCLAASSALLIGTNFVRPVLIAQLRARDYASVDFVTALGQLSVTLVLLATHRLSVQTALLTPLAASLAGMAIVFWHLRSDLTLRVAAFWATLRDLLVYGVQMATRTIAYVALTTAPALMLPRMLPQGFEAVGLYRAATGVCGLVGLIGMAATPLLYSSLSAQSEDEQRARQVELTTRLYTLMGGGIAILLILFDRLTLKYLYSEAFTSASPLLRYLAIGTAIQMVANAMQNLFPAVGRPMLSAAMFAATLVLNVGLNLLLIPRWQVEGAAVAMMISAAVFLVMSTYMSVRVCGIRLSQCFIPRRDDVMRVLRAIPLPARLRGRAT